MSAEQKEPVPLNNGLLAVSPETTQLKGEGIFLDHYRFERPDIGIWMQWVARNTNKSKVLRITFDFTRCTGLNLNGPTKQEVVVGPEETKKVADIKSEDPYKSVDCPVSYNYVIAGPEPSAPPKQETKSEAPPQQQSTGGSPDGLLGGSPLGPDGLLAVTPQTTVLKTDNAWMDLYRLENTEVGLWMQWVCRNDNKKKTLTFTFDFSKCVDMDLNGPAKQEIEVLPGVTKKVAEIKASNPQKGCECSANYNYVIQGPD